MTTTQLRRENNKLTRKLTHENHQMITNMIVYLRVSRLSDERVEGIRHDILDIAISAQARNEPLDDVFGEDGKTFCDEILANVKPEGWLIKIVKLMPGLIGTFGFFSILNLVSSGYPWRIIRAIRHHSPITWQYPITMGLVVNTLLCFAVAIVIVQLIGKFSFRKQKTGRTIPSMVKLSIVGLIGGLAWAYIDGIHILGRIVLIHVNFGGYLAVAIPLCGYFVWMIKRSG